MGQIGVGLAKILREKYGKDNIILSDVKKASKGLTKSGPYVYADVLDFKGLQEIVVNNDIDLVIHMSAILSAVGENNVPLALRINIEGVHNVLELAKQHKLRIFIPSTIGIYSYFSLIFKLKKLKNWFYKFRQVLLVVKLHSFQAHQTLQFKSPK